MLKWPSAHWATLNRCRKVEWFNVKLKKPLTKKIHKVHNDSVHEFEIENAKHYIELNKTEVEVMLRIKKADGTNLAPADNVELINYLIASLFKDIEIKHNDETITSGLSNYADRAIMEVLLTYNRDAVKRWLLAGGFEYDTEGTSTPSDGSTQQSTYIIWNLYSTSRVIDDKN